MLSLVNTRSEEVLRFFCKHPTTEYSVTEVAEALDASKPSISQQFDKLEQKNILKVEKKRNNKLASFNRDENLQLKQLVNLNELMNSPILEKITQDYSHPEAVILFGSFAKGEDTEKSDIDIAVISADSQNKNYGEVLGRKISITEFKPGNIPENMKETLANGINLQGYLEV